jgi:hypothetical protein
MCDAESHMQVENIDEIVEIAKAQNEKLQELAMLCDMQDISLKLLMHFEDSIQSFLENTPWDLYKKLLEFRSSQYVLFTHEGLQIVEEAREGAVLLLDAVGALIVGYGTLHWYHFSMQGSPGRIVFAICSHSWKDTLELVVARDLLSQMDSIALLADSQTLLTWKKGDMVSLDLFTGTTLKGYQASDESGNMFAPLESLLTKDTRRSLIAAAKWSMGDLYFIDIGDMYEIRFDRTPRLHHVCNVLLRDVLQVYKTTGNLLLMNYHINNFVNIDETMKLIEATSETGFPLNHIVSLPAFRGRLEIAVRYTGLRVAYQNEGLWFTVMLE